MSDDQRGGRMRGQLATDDPSGIGTTIVGGQPPGAPRRPLRAVPVGIEKVLYTAAIDPGFRQALLRDREAAIHAQGLELEGSELAMLRLAPEAQLASAIAALDISETNLARRGFMRAVAGAVTLAAGTVLTGCDEKIEPIAGVTDGGFVPDLGPDRKWPSGSDVAGMTDRSWLDAPAPAGIRPDEAGVSDGKMADGARQDGGKKDGK